MSIALEIRNELGHATGHGKTDGGADNQRRHDGEAVGGEQAALGDEAHGERDEEHWQIAHQQPCSWFKNPEWKDASCQCQKREQQAGNVARHRQLEERDDLVPQPAHEPKQPDLRGDCRELTNDDLGPG